MRQTLRSTALALALAAMVAQPARAQTESAADIVVNMRGVEIADVSDQISRITGRTLILDPAVKGVVTVTSAEPLTPNGVWELYQSVLRANGFAAVRSGRAWRVVPQGNAVRDGGVASRSASGQELTTRMIRLANVPSAEVARVVRPLVATFGSVEPLTAPNAIVVTDYADNIRRIEGIARSLDGGSGTTFATIVLRNGNAADVAQALSGVLGDQSGTRVAADVRSNTLIIRGTPSGVSDARRMAASLDAPGGATPITRVFRLSYADSESVTNVLRGVLGQAETVSNPVARSLSSSNRIGGGPNSPTSTLNNLIASGGNNTTAMAGALGQSGASTATIGNNANGATAIQGFSTPELTVQPAPEINAIVVRGAPQAIAGIEAIITDLDVRRPQVMIEAAIAEISGEDAESLSVQLGTGAAVLDQVEGAGTSFGNFGNSLSRILGVLGVPIGQVLGNGATGNISINDQFSILVQALGTSTKSNLLSTPQITTLDNGMGEIIVGQEVPFVTGSILTNSSTTTPYTSIERKDVGITLRVIPRINAGDTIRLEVQQEASSIAPTASTRTADIVTNRRAVTTTVLADNGQTIMLGGLISDDYIQSRQQVPLLGDIPLVGELFRSRSESRGKRTLFIFLKPTILRDGQDAAAAAKAKYAKMRGEEIDLKRPGLLLINPPGPRLTVEIDGIY